VTAVLTALVIAFLAWSVWQDGALERELTAGYDELELFLQAVLA
jgi:hypothetical protein